MTQDDLQRIHDASLRLLDEIGVRFEHDAIVALLRRAGGRPGAGAQEVRLPPALVDEALRRAPATVTLDARDGTAAVLAPDSPPVYWTAPAMYVWDGTARREATEADLVAVARLCDHLPHAQGVIGMAISDVPPPCRDFAGLRAIARGGRKHARVLCFTPAGMEALLAMRPVFPGNWFSLGFTAHGPLRWTGLALEIFRRSAGHGIPVTLNGEPMAGVSGPVTLAGTLAVGNAEILAGLVVNQLLEPGRPVIYNLGLAHTFDMRHATAVTGGPENALLAAAGAALGRFYRLPSSSWVSTEAVCEDAQAGLEKIFGFHTHAAHGVSVIWGMGQLESEKTLSLAQLLLDEEMLAYCDRYARGIPVDDAALAVDLIRQVGIAGSFLETEHTLDEFRAHLWQPALLNRRPREAGATDAAAAARAAAARILADDTEDRLPPADARALAEIDAHYRARILGNK